MSTERGKPALISGDDIRKECAEYRRLEQRLLDQSRALRFFVSSCVNADSAMQKLRGMAGASVSGNKAIHPEKRNWVSVKQLRKCLFARRNGFYGARILGLSICIRIAGKDLL